MYLGGYFNTQEPISSSRRQEIGFSQFYKCLVNKRAKREASFINDRGFRHIKNREDLSGSTFTFWMIK